MGLVVAGAALSSLASAWAGSASAAGACPCLAVHRPDGTVQILSAADVNANADVNDTQYETRAVANGPAQDEPYVNQGLTVRGALMALTPPLDPSTVGFTESPHTDGTWAALTTADLAAPSDFPDGLRPAVRIDGNVLEYVRPLRGSSDVNADDLLRTAPGGTLDLYVHTGPLLDVTISASSTQVAVGQPVTLTATTTGSPATLSTYWHVGDGATATGTPFAHTFTAPGSYLIVATVTGDDDSGGSSNPLVITVGAPAPTTAAPGGGGGSASHKPTHGTTGHPSSAPASHPASTPTPDASASTAPSSTPATTTPSAATASVRPSPRSAAPTARPPTSAAPDRLTGRIVGAGTRVDPAVLEQPRLADSAAATGTHGVRPLGKIAGVLVALLLVLIGALAERRTLGGGRR